MKYVFLHGLGQTTHSWQPVLSRLKPQIQATCPDLFLGVKDGNVSYDALYSSLETYCAHLQKPFCLCGLSLGGVLALQYTLDHPQKVQSLVLISAQASMPKGLLRVQNALFRIIPRSAFMGSGLEKEAMIALCRSMMELDFSPRLHQIACPTLVLYGEKDRANRKASIQLAENISGSQLKIIPHAGHEVNTEAPQELTRTLTEFWT